MKAHTPEGPSARVRAFPAKPAEDTPAHWGWVEPAVGTERMLGALKTGVQGGKWYSLMDKVAHAATLQAAWRQVRANQGAAGVDGQSIGAFERQVKPLLARLQMEVRTGWYRPYPVQRRWIAKQGRRERRPLGIPAVRDRVVQTALCSVLEPIVDQQFAANSYGFRPGRRAHAALACVEQALQVGATWVVEIDWQSYFDSIPHEPLMQQLRRWVADGAVLSLVARYLTAGVMEGITTWVPEQGTPQGGSLSPLLANVYLNPLDHLMAMAQHHMIRYADDAVVLCRSRADAEQALTRVQQWSAQQGLTMHPEKTRIVDATQHGGFDFLGYHFERGYRWPRRKSLKQMKDKLRAKTKRTSGHALGRVIQEVNQTLRGWYMYFQYSHRTTFPALDGWIRMRLRSILRRRQKRRGRARGLDHQRWPNAFFTAQGLYSLTTTHEAASRSP